jgi:hypothetical protein
MSDPLDLELGLWDCRGIRAESDVIEVVRLIAEQGLVPGVGPWTATATPRPITPAEITAFVPGVHFASGGSAKRSRGRSVDRLTPMETWGYAALRPEMPGGQAQVGIGRLGEDNWEASVLVSAWSHARAGVPLHEFIASWAPLLERIGAALYGHTRPVLGAITASPSTSYESDQLSGHALRRRLVVGWRTWLGPAYVEAFGRDLLLGLPDRAQPLEDGGVFHGLDAPAVSLVQGDPAIYNAVWPYLEQAGITPAWPRPRRARPARRQ